MGDFGVAQTFHEQLENLALAWGQVDCGLLAGFGRLPDWANSEAATRSVAMIAANPCFADLAERMSKLWDGFQSPGF